MLVLLLLVGFELKHFIADYLLQTGWMIAGKGNLASPGGYAHAGVHVIGSIIVLALARVPVVAIAELAVAEFVIHYAFDFAKVYYGRGIDPDEDAQRFWALHGLDQLFHQLTYVAMIYFALRATGRGDVVSPLRLYLLGARLRAGFGAGSGSAAVASTSEPRIWSTTSRSCRLPSACCCRSTR